VNIYARLWLRNVLTLKYQRERFLCASGPPRKFKGIFIRRKRVIVVATVLEIRCAALRMAPNTIFQHLIPDESATRAGERRVFTNSSWVEHWGILRVVFHRRSGIKAR
jgi:hypothetical protein